MDLLNLTPFGATALPSANRDGDDLVLVVVAARFVIPEPLGASPFLLPTHLQAPPPFADAYIGDPSRSSLKLEGQSAYTRAATDIYVRGEACAPEGFEVEAMEVGITVGPCLLRLGVVGDRIWLPSPADGAMPSRPQRFSRMPLEWERSFGGAAPESTPERPIFDNRNPIGCGLGSGIEPMLGMRLPNIEHPTSPIRRVGDRPLPVGILPIARHWQPRASRAGTYDEEWRRERAPLWPKDFDERFFSAAPEALQADPYLAGGERVLLEGMHPRGNIDFELPLLRLAMHSRFASGEARRMLVLDGVGIDTIDLELTLFFRGTVPAPLGLSRHRQTQVRLLEAWEADVG